MNRWIGMVGCGAGIMVAGCGATPGGKDASSADASSMVGKSAPEVNAEYVEGDGPKTLAEARGMVAIVDFWATFCAPCRKSFPMYQGLVDQHAGKLAVIAVSVDDPDVDVEDVKKFAHDTGVSFAIVWDKADQTACSDDCPYNPPAMPTSYVVDKQGIVRSVHATYEGGDAERLDAEIEGLLN